DHGEVQAWPEGERHRGGGICHRIRPVRNDKAVELMPALIYVAGNVDPLVGKYVDTVFRSEVLQLYCGDRVECREVALKLLNVPRCLHLGALLKHPQSAARVQDANALADGFIAPVLSVT